MASNNSTPQSVLDAPVLEPVILEGTEFNGSNRAWLRSFGKHKGFTPKGAGASKTGSPDWFKAMVALRLDNSSVDEVK